MEESLGGIICPGNFTEEKQAGSGEDLCLRSQSGVSAELTASVVASVNIPPVGREMSTRWEEPRASSAGTVSSGALGIQMQSWALGRPLHVSKSPAGRITQGENEHLSLGCEQDRTSAWRR